MEIDPINDIGTPITDETFLKQGWERVEEEENGNTFYYWVLPLPKDNPDMRCSILISSANDDWEFLGIPEDTYRVEIKDLNGLGVCDYEEDVEDLYSVLTGEDIYEKK